jgi:predicted metal-dependent HD superfamily phosphohydrolase
MKDPDTKQMASWRRCWDGLGASGDGERVGQDLLDRYAESHRHYHTLQHLQECLDWLEKLRDQAQYPEEVEAALWFHDAVYDLQAADNEEQSANLARIILGTADVEPGRVSRISELILNTRHKAPATTSDGRLLTDIDLAILGAPEDRFAEYESQIRAEYDWVPEAVFREKRREVLRSFLTRDRIYHTDFLHDKLEAPARRNLSKAVGL